MTGDMLRKLMTAYKFKMSDLSKKLNISPQALNSKLKSKDLSADFLDSVAKALGIEKFLLLNPKGGSVLQYVLKRHGYDSDVLIEKGISKDKLDEIFSNEKIFSDDLESLNSIVDFDLDKLTLAYYGIPGKIRTMSPEEIRYNENQIESLYLAEPHSEYNNKWEQKYYSLLNKVKKLFEDEDNNNSDNH